MIKKRGFTVVELVVVILVGVVLTSIASNALSSAKGRMAARQARNTFASSTPVTGPARSSSAKPPASGST